MVSDLKKKKHLYPEYGNNFYNLKNFNKKKMGGKGRNKEGNLSICDNTGRPTGPYAE